MTPLSSPQLSLDYTFNQTHPKNTLSQVHDLWCLERSHLMSPKVKEMIVPVRVRGTMVGSGDAEHISLNFIAA